MGVNKCWKMQVVDNIGSKFLRQVLRRMKQLGLNQSELAKQMNVSRPYVSKVLRSNVNISFVTAAKLAHALQMDFFPELRERASRTESTNNWSEQALPA